MPHFGFGWDSVLFDGWFQTMTRKMHFLKVAKFRIHGFYEIKIM